MNEHQIADIWILFKEYMDKKTLDVSAERFVELLVEHGVSEKTLEAAVGYDDYLDEAIEYYLNDNEDDDGFEEDNWDFDSDD